MKVYGTADSGGRRYRLVYLGDDMPIRRNRERGIMRTRQDAHLGVSPFSGVQLQLPVWRHRSYALGDE